MPSEQKIIVIPDGKICDYIDGKFRNDTPEEYVRQTIEKRLVNEHKYLPEQIRIEYTLQVGSNKPRADIVIWEEGADQTQGTIKLIIECKKETVDARNAKDGIAQLKSYMSVCPNCEWGMWTNSVQKYVFRKAVDAAGNITFMEYNDIPAADGNLDEVNRPSRTSLKNAYDDNLLFVFKTCHNHIYVNDGMQKQPAFFELLKVIFCKIEDERNIPNPLEFYTTSEERSNPDGQLTVQKRIGKIFQRVKKRHGKIFDANDEIKLSPRSLAYIVSELQRYSLLNTKIDIKGKAYEEIVGANLRGDRGEFFTPRNVMKMVVEMVNPQVDEHVLDSSCGTGGFLVMAMTHVIDQLEQRFSTSLGIKRENWDSDTLRAFQDRISEMASSNYFGFDINPDLVKATKMNMVMNNDGSGNILQTNSLLPPHEWYDDFRSRLAEALGINKNTLRNHSSIGYERTIEGNACADAIGGGRKMKAVIYARYSSDSQREESIEGQLRECTAFAEKNGITVLRHYIDRAYSAKTDNRPEFQSMIKDSGKRLFDIVIVWKLDRFARNRYDSARYKATLKKNGVKVVSATEIISEGAEGIIKATAAATVAVASLPLPVKSPSRCPSSRGFPLKRLPL